MIDRYVYEIEPYNFSGPHGGIEKTLTIRVTVNGEEHVMSRVIPNQRPFETEVEYYSRMATSMLHDKLKELNEANGE